MKTTNELPKIDTLLPNQQISYKEHKETEESKAHTDVLVNGEYVGHYVNDSLTLFIEWEGEMYAGDFDSVEQIEEAVKEIIS